MSIKQINKLRCGEAEQLVLSWKRMPCGCVLGLGRLGPAWAAQVGPPQGWGATEGSRVQTWPQLAGFLGLGL